ncbi:MAG: hypothetical protein U0X91_21245 [Spirosomataceae bacterium]
MNRFSILYLLQEKYRHITYPTRSEAYAALENFSAHHSGNPIGVYDAKTELFYWEIPQFEYNKMSIAEQGKRGNEVINIIQELRSREEAEGKDETLREGDVMMRPLPLSIPKLTLPFYHVKLAEVPKKQKRRAKARRQKSLLK